MERVRISARRRAAFEQDWTKGSIIGNLWSLSWPTMISSSLNMIGPTIDMIWVGRLGAASIAAVGVSGMAVMLVNSLIMGLFTSLRAMVGRFVGAGDDRSAIHAARQAFVVSIAFSIVMAVIGIFLAERILMLTGVKAEVISQGAAYLRIQFVGMVAMTFLMMTQSTMQASGDVVTPMKITISLRLLHIALCPFLIFGWWLFPRMGVTGAATTTVLSQSLGAALGWWFLLTGRSRLRLTFAGFRIDGNIIWRMVKVGIPASIMGMERSLGNIVLLRIMAPFGTLAVAAHTLGGRVDMVLFMPTMALGMAASVLAAQNLGASQPERAEKAGWLAAGLGESFMVASSVAILLWAEAITRIFTSDSALVDIGSSFLRINAAGYMFMGVGAILQQCIAGVGDTLPTMLASLGTMWLVQLPLAFLLPRVTNLGVYGVRWAIVASMFVGVIFCITYFRLGRWKRKKV